MKIKNTRFNYSYLAMIFAISFFTFYVNIGSAIAKCGPATITPLMSKKGLNLGMVEVYNDSETLYVTYIAEEGLVLSELYLAIGSSLEEIPQKKNKPELKLFPSHNKLTNPREDYTYTFNLADNGYTPETALYIAAYAHVGILKEPGKVSKKSKVWAEGTRFESTKNPTFFIHNIQTCETCEVLNPTDEQIEAAVKKALIGIDNPMGKIDDFELFLERVEFDLGCVVQSPNEMDQPDMSNDHSYPQASCAEDGIYYCGIGTSKTNSKILPGRLAPSILNDSCCRHDACYGETCVDPDCYWTHQSVGCDAALYAACLETPLTNVLSRIFCIGIGVLITDGHLTKDSKCKEDATCTIGPDPDCIGSTCGNFTSCNPGSGCGSPICASIAEGGGACVEGTTSCDESASCSTSEDCPGSLCFVDTCCGRPVCAPEGAFCPDIGAESVHQEYSIDDFKEGLTFGGI